MALPLKSGADLYNNQALRLRLHNLGADPTEVGAGLIYFNTSTGLNTSQKARLYTGSAWKTIAFSEDLDVASNADFLALKDKVDTLIGDGVDMDGIIESWKEVEAFLSGMSDTKSLMDLLNGKLNTSGGTINGSLTLNEGALYFISGGKQYAYNVNTGDGEPIYLKNDAWQTLLHSGNVGEYKAGDADKLGGVAKGRFVFGDNETKTTNITESAFEQPLASGFYAISGATNLPSGTSYNTALRVSYSAANLRAGFDLLIGDKAQSPLYFRPANGDGVGDWKTIAFTDSNVASAQALTHSNGTVGAMVGEAGNLCINKRISSADDSLNLFEYSAGFLYLGYSLRNEHTTRVYGNKIEFLTGDTQIMHINSSGNVLIGTTTDKGAKLQVAGTIVSESITHRAYISDNAITHYNKTNGGFFLYGGVREGEALSIEIAGNTGSWVGQGITLKQNGNVGIGTSNPTEKLDIEGGIRVNGHIYPKWGNNSDLGKNSQRWNNIFAVKASFTEDVIIDGDLHVKGNIIADGEVSAGGAGTEGGGSSSGGGGAFHSESIGVGATQTTIAHGLGTDDIVVSIYEKDGVSGRWSIILTDVEIVDANNIIVSFGSATTVEHKVVIMGAVA